MANDSVFKRIGSIIATTIDTAKAEMQVKIDSIPLPSKASLGIGDVDNTSDLNKPISTDTQTALDGKSDITHNHAGVYEPADTSILKNAKIGVTVQAYNANTVIDSAYIHTDNNYTTADKSKLAGIEVDATADQTASEIKIAYESNTNTNAYTDADKTKLGGIETGAQVNTVTSVAGKTGAVTLDITDVTVNTHIIPTADITYDLGSATHRFRDLWLSSNTIKMGDFGISVSPTGTITTASIADPTTTSDLLTDGDVGVTVQAYNMDTVVDGAYVHTDNNYTTTEKTKLAGIETGATADQTAAEILTLLKTVDGTGSGLDADLLDGQTGTYYTDYTDTKIAALVSASPATLDTLNELATALGNDPNFATTVSTQIGTKLDASAYTAADVLTKVKTVDGTGSGLDADLLDGQHGTYYQQASTALTTTTAFTGDVSGTYNTLVVANDSHSHTISTVTGLQTALDAKLASSSYTAADVLTKIKTVDGSGSGLDADTLDGIDSAGYIRYYQQAAAPTVANDGSIWKDTDTGMLFMAANDTGVLTWIGM
jgi:hypothetical protein